MAQSFELNVLTAGKSFAKVQATALTIPGSLGYMTILPDHSAFVSELSVGEMVITEQSSQAKTHYFISGGFVEVVGQTVNVLADVVEAAADVDRAAAEQEKASALKQLAGTQSSADSIDTLTFKLREAEARLEVAK